jgi:threonine/homoserine/homoserine lactone efflux protein
MLESLIKGFGLGIILAVSVGPVIFTILKQSINNGHKGGFSFVGGVWLSDILLVIIANMFSTLVMQALHFKATIAYIGAAFVLGMGIYYVFFKKVVVADENKVVAITFGKKAFTRSFMSGFIINTLNPSVMLFWLINATAFAATHTVVERSILFGTCLLVNIIADVVKVLLAAKVRHSLTPHNIKMINKVSGTILIGFAVAIVYGVYFLNK